MLKVIHLKNLHNRYFRLLEHCSVALAILFLFFISCLFIFYCACTVCVCVWLLPSYFYDTDDSHDWYLLFFRWPWAISKCTMNESSSTANVMDQFLWFVCLHKRQVRHRGPMPVPALVSVPNQHGLTSRTILDWEVSRRQSSSCIYSSRLVNLS